MTSNCNCIFILSLSVSFMVHFSCVCFVIWKSTECFMKFYDYPYGTKLEIKHAANTDQFPTITICAMNEGVRWNYSHLNYCGIKGYNYKDYYT